VTIPRRGITEPTVGRGETQRGHPCQTIERTQKANIRLKKGETAGGKILRAAGKSSIEGEISHLAGERGEQRTTVTGTR